MDENFLYGKLIIPSQTPKALVIFYPPATGDKGHQLEEAKKFKDLNYASLLYNPPYRIKQNQGGLSDPEGEMHLWNEAKIQFSKVVKDLRNYFNADKLKVFVIGKNLGGSVAAYSIDKSVSCLIVTGSVPDLSNFWTTSHHPVAVDARKGISIQQLNIFRSKMSEFDLLETLPSLNQKILIQFGKKDPWIESEHTDSLKKIIHKNSVIQWTNDDHVMALDESVNSRIEFLKKQSICFPTATE